MSRNLSKLNLKDSKPGMGKTSVPYHVCVWLHLCVCMCVYVCLYMCLYMCV